MKRASLILLLGCGTHGGTFDDDAGRDAGVVTQDGAKTEACTPVTWAPDYDGDGFGPAYGTTDGLRISCTKPSDPLPFGTWVSNTRDCADRDPAAHPGVTMWSTIGVAGPHPNTPIFDFDCDGKETEEYGSGLGSCMPDAMGGCTLTPGWYMTAPACGEMGTFVIGCGNVQTTFCTEDPNNQRLWSRVNRTQGCR